MQRSWQVTAAGLVTAAGDDGGSVCEPRHAPRRASPAAVAHPIADFDPRATFERKGLRHLSRTSQLACAAAARLEDDLRVVPPTEVGVVLGSAWASLDSIVRFEREAHVEGPRFVDPGLFAETVANVPAGHVSIFFGWSALNATIAAGAASGLQAIVTALELLGEDRAGAIVAGGADAASPHVQRERGTDFAGGEGACLLLIEPAERAAARGARPLGRLSAGAVRWDDRPATLDAGLLRELLDRASLDPRDVDLVVATRGAGAFDRQALRATFGEEPPPVLTPEPALGETWAAAGPLAVVLALEAMRQRSVRHALVIDGAETGYHGALVVSAAE